MRRLSINHFLKKCPVIPLFILYTGVQAVLLFVIDVPFGSDSLHYYRLAADCVRHHSFYPAPHNLFDEYILAPLFINYSICLLKCWQNPQMIHIANLFLNSLLALLTYFIVRRATRNRDYAKIALILYMLYLNSLGAVFLNLTEFMFCLFILAALFLILSKKPGGFFVAGMFAACAFNVRPLGIVLPFCVSAAICIQKFSGKRKLLMTAVFLSGFVMAAGGLGFLSKITFGHFITTSTNGSVNILIGASEHATGTFNSDVFLPGNRGYIPDEETVPYYKKNQIWRTRAIEWIRNNPGQWLILLPVKLTVLYLWDDWALHPLLNSNQWNLYSVMKTTLKDKKENRFLKESSAGFVIRFIVLHIIHYAYYLFILFSGLRAVVQVFRTGIQKSDFLQQIIVLFILCASGLVMIVYGTARYKYPMVLLFIILIPVCMSKRGTPVPEALLSDSSQ